MLETIISAKTGKAITVAVPDSVVRERLTKRRAALKVQLRETMTARNQAIKDVQAVGLGISRKGAKAVPNKLITKISAEIREIDRQLARLRD